MKDSLENQSFLHDVEVKRDDGKNTYLTFLKYVLIIAALSVGIFLISRHVVLSPLLCSQCRLISPKPSKNNSTNNETLQMIVRMEIAVSSLARALDFLEAHNSSLNLDGVIGIRWASGILQAFLENSPASVHLEHEYPEIHKEIVQLQLKAASVGDLCHATLQGDYYEGLKQLVDPEFWNTWYPSRRTNASLGVSTGVTNIEALPEDIKDQCMKQLLGTECGISKNCCMTDKCLMLMTNPGYSGYTLSHQLYYFQIGSQAGCFDEEIASGEVSQHMDTTCASMMTSMEALEKREDKHDLFSENIAMCGISGFSDFFIPEWLEDIVAWQWPSGCWKHKGHEKRQKRREQLMEGDCSAHGTAVAVGALAGFVRYIAENITELAPN